MKLLLPFWIQLFISKIFSTRSWGSQTLSVRHWLVFWCWPIAQCQCLWNSLKTPAVNLLNCPQWAGKQCCVTDGFSRMGGFALLPLAAGIRTLTCDCERKKHHCREKKENLSDNLHSIWRFLSSSSSGECSASLQRVLSPQLVPWCPSGAPSEGRAAATAFAQQKRFPWRIWGNVGPAALPGPLPSHCVPFVAPLLESALTAQVGMVPSEFWAAALLFPAQAGSVPSSPVPCPPGGAGGFVGPGPDPDGLNRARSSGILCDPAGTGHW